ncbi:hypothetical protein VARIO8X_150012 [Burkholderiales bacterium 8X]|nr:hypothetical protein VARIO8X_150012 [Burkholderiales bacterium 8X]
MIFERQTKVEYKTIAVHLHNKEYSRIQKNCANAWIPPGPRKPRSSQTPINSSKTTKQIRVGVAADLNQNRANS